MIRIGAFKGNGVISKLIKWRTGGEYSHIGLCLDWQYWIDAQYGRGVRKVIYLPSQSGIEVDIYKADFKDENIVRKFLAGQLGKKYDLRAALNIGVCHKEDRHLSDKWFCSELAYAALQKGKVNAFNDTLPWEVDPNILVRSTALTYVETVKLKDKPFIL
jgi:hypothetical protein